MLLWDGGGIFPAMDSTMVFLRVMDELERFVGWPMFCWRHDRGMVIGILERMEWLVVRRWQHSPFMVLRERILERLRNMMDRLLKGVDRFILSSYSERVCNGVSSLGEAMCDWKMEVELEMVLVQRGRVGGIFFG